VETDAQLVARFCHRGNVARHLDVHVATLGHLRPRKKQPDRVKAERLNLIQSEFLQRIVMKS